MKEVDVAVIGGGISGLCCTKSILESGYSCLLVEGGDEIGGCLRTDTVDGFLLDRGFQIYLTAYEEPKAFLDLAALNLQRFERGALVRRGEEFVELLDPWRHPLAAPKMLFNGFGSLRDKFLMVRLRQRALSGTVPELFERSATSTFFFLREFGFSTEWIDGFFRPFFGSIFLEGGLETSSRMFEYLFRMFAVGEAALPEKGIEAIPQQLKAQLPEGTVRLHTKVRALEDGKLAVDRGEKVKARKIVVATGAAAARRLVPALPEVEYRAVTCLYYSAPQVPLEKPYLVIDASEGSLISNLSIPSLVQRSYAPEGLHLVSVTVLGLPAAEDKELERAIRQQLFDWYGAPVREWKHLRTYRIAQALPALPPHGGVAEQFLRYDDTFLVGDYFGNASLEGAMLSARVGAQAVVEALRRE